jgi:hypothetical protein
LRYIGFDYRITREFREGLIDCSSLVSQAHWLGAAVQTPFIADSQRTAANGHDVAADDLLPGDLIFAYRSRRDSPGGRHNHVGLYMAADSSGVSWVMESRDPLGVMFTPLSQFPQAGGLRRYAPSPEETFESGVWTALAARVPKLGRLGAKLTSRYWLHDRHHGVDLYVPDGAEVRSPAVGTLVGLTALGPTARRLEIADLSEHSVSVLFVDQPSMDLRLGDNLAAGEVLGLAGGRHGHGSCNVAPHGWPNATAKVHWELWSTLDFPSPAPDLRMRLQRRQPEDGAFRAQNPLYQLKLGRIGSPVLQSSIDSDSDLSAAGPLMDELER